MGNILAVAQKELRSYFTSPIASVVVGFYALLFGYFFIAMLSFFVRQSMQMGMGMGPASMNINQQMVRPLFLNASVLILFVGPIITMRTYAEEKRSGTMELLLTSPVTDIQIIVGKFIGALGLYAAMLLVTLVYL
ncbi:MAG: ABC transporter permease subunit, partial [Acidobacteria bacterium]|nr:ABC transporter permease subunit [Acidobacteriota bacterium]